MPPLGLPLALVILTGPADPAADKLAHLRPHVQFLALHFEILDPRETRYVLARDDGYEIDLKMLRGRWHDLKDAPPLVDADRFPNRELLNDLLLFNSTYRGHLTCDQDLDTLDRWDRREAIVEVDRLHDLYDTVRDACCPYYYVTVRRLALKKLRELLGDEAYGAACLPPHIPLRFLARLN